LGLVKFDIVDNLLLLAAPEC